MPLEVGGALRSRLGAEDRGRRSEVRDQRTEGRRQRTEGRRLTRLEVGGALRLRLEAEGRFEILDWRCGIRDVGSQQAKCGLKYVIYTAAGHVRVDCSQSTAQTLGGMF